MFPKRRKPDNELTVTLGSGAKATLDSLANHYKKSPEEMASELLRDTLFARQENLFGRHSANYEEIPAIVRMANAVLSSAIDAGKEEILLVPAEGRVRVMVRTGTEESELMSFPPHILRPLLERFETMTGTRLSRLDAAVEALIPIVHNAEGYTVMAGYVVPKCGDAEGSLHECLRLRITKNDRQTL